MVIHRDTPRARRVEVKSADRGAAGGADYVDADYVDAFEVEIASGSAAGSAEWWARRMFEDAPAPVRALLWVGWRGVLGLRLGPGGSPGHVLGWAIADRRPGALVLSLGSRWMSARLDVVVDSAVLRQTTRVRFLRAPGRWLWAAVAPIHRLIVPWVLTHAAAARDAVSDGK